MLLWLWENNKNQRGTRGDAAPKLYRQETRGYVLSSSKSTEYREEAESTSRERLIDGY